MYVDNIKLTKNFKISNFEKIKLNYIDIHEKKNDLIISKNKEQYIITGKEFDISNIVDEILKNDDESSLKLFDKKNRIFKVNFDKNYIDEEHYLLKLKGKFQIKNNDLYDMDFNSKFFNNKNLSLSVKTKNNNKVTTFYSDYAKPFVKKYKFIKGFEEGKIDFLSTKKNKRAYAAKDLDTYPLAAYHLLKMGEYKIGTLNGRLPFSSIMKVVLVIPSYFFPINVLASIHQQHSRNVPR